jgi:MFS family permease
MADDVKVLGMAPESGRWVLVIVGLLIQLCLGAIYAYGALRGSIQGYFKTLGLNPSAMDMTWPFIVFLAFFAITMPLAGPYIQKVGPKKVCMVGGALCGLGWIAASFAQSPYMLIPLYGIIGGIGVGIAYGCPIAVSAAWFPDKRGLAVGLTVLGFGLSSAIISYSTKFMLDSSVPIMRILQIFGIVFLIVTVVLSMFLAFPKAGWCPAGWKPPAPKAGAAPAANLTRDEMKKTTAFYGLWSCYTIGALAGLTAIGIAGAVGTEVYTPIYAAQLGLPADSAEVAKAVKDWIFLLIIPFALVNGLGRPVFGTLTDKLGPKNTALVTYVLIFAACMLMYLQYGSGTAYILLPVALGMSGRLAGNCAYGHGKLLRHQGLCKELRLNLHCLRCRRRYWWNCICTGKRPHGRLSALLPDCGSSSSNWSNCSLDDDEAPCSG